MVNVLLIIILAGVVAVAAIIGYSVYSNGQASQQLPGFQNTSAQVPSTFSGMLGLQGSAATLQLAALSKNGLSNSSQLTVVYGGSLSGSVSISSFDTPVRLTESKYGHSMKMSINATSIPLIGSVNVTYMNTTNRTSVCSNLNASYVSSGDYQKLLLGSHANSCSNDQYFGGINMQQVADFNLTFLEGQGIQLNYTKDYQSTYHSVPCTYLSGTLSGASGSGLFGMCVSDSNYLPLSLAIYFSGKSGSGLLVLNQSSISNQSSQAYINSAPG